MIEKTDAAASTGTTADNDTPAGGSAGDSGVEGAAVAPPAEPAVPSPIAAAEAPAEASATEDVDRESIEVEAVVIRAKPTTARPAAHLPPPPPSIRVKGATATLDVAGNPTLAQDLMIRKLFTIGQEDTLEHLEEHMQAFRFRHLPVVEDRKLIGLITHADLLRASSSLFSAKAKEQDEIIHKLPARHIMQKDFVTVRPTTPLVDVAVAMWEARVGCVLVTEEDGTLVGIITEADFIRLVHHLLSQPKAGPTA